MTRRMVYRGEAAMGKTRYSVSFEGELLGYAEKRNRQWFALTPHHRDCGVSRRARWEIGEHLFFERKAKVL